MKRVLFTIVVVGQAWVGGYALAAGCSTGSAFDANCQSLSMSYGDSQSAGRFVTAAPSVATPASAARDLPLIAAPSAAASSLVLDAVVASTSPSSQTSVFVPAVSTRSEGITIAGIAVPELTTAVIRPDSASDVTVKPGGGVAALESSPTPAIGVTAIPEPDVLLLLGAGLVAVALSRAQRTRAAARTASPC